MADSTLDQAETYSRLDPSGLYSRIASLPQQFRQAWDAAVALELPASYRDVERIVVLGMGGSGIGGALLGALAVGLDARTPVQTVRGYGLPRHVDARSLVFASSNSGNTEETVAAFAEALKSGARCVAITGGGRLATMAGEAGVPTLVVDWPHEPRAALGWSFASLVAICAGLGLLPDVTYDRDVASARMESVVAVAGRDVLEHDNPAKALARRWYGSLPIIIATDGLIPVAYRWRTQINENGKSWAAADEISELNHNAPVGYALPSEVVGLLRVTLLCHPNMHPRNALRVDLTAEQMRTAGIDVQIIDASGGTLLQQMLWTVQMGDLASYYLGLLYEQDPSEVRALESLKSRLSAQP